MSLYLIPLYQILLWKEVFLMSFETSAEPSANPLINPPYIHFNAPALDRVKPEHFMPAIDHGIALARAEVDAIRNNPDAPTFENTIEALEFSGKALNMTVMIFLDFASAHANADINALRPAISLKVSQFGNDVGMDSVLFDRIKAVYSQRDQMNLSQEQEMLLEKTYKGYVRNGADLDANQKQRWREIDEELASLTSAFGTNLKNATKAYKKVIDDENDLRGVPQRAKDLYAGLAEKMGLPGKFVISLSPPPSEIFSHCENRALREEIYRAQTMVGEEAPNDNRPILPRIVALRHEKAQLLGFDTYAAFALDERMAKTPEAVNAFLDKNASVYRPAAEDYLEKLKIYAQQRDGQTQVAPWDIGFYGRRLKEETFSVDMEELRKYFEIGRVFDGMCRHAEKLFDIQIRPVSAGEYPVQNADMGTYEVYDNRSGDIMGVFYTDYYARDGAKSNGAWASNYRKRGRDGDESQVPLIYNVCNYAKPEDGSPALLSLDEVRTMFHEFGHGLHSLLSVGSYTSLTGTAVKRDFVELPSQVQENWMLEKEVLDTFARHKDTGQPLTQALVDKIAAMDNFGIGYMGLRQTFFGKLDMAWYGDASSGTKTVEDVEDKVIADVWLFPRAAGTQSSSFSHIVEGYAAGYYGYKWAEVLDADVFAAFKKAGLYNRELGDRLRDTIYSKGGSADPMELFVAMMGREPDPEALFRREGLVGGKPSTDTKKPGAKPDDLVA